jgi:hypothetical protein
MGAVVPLSEVLHGSSHALLDPRPTDPVGLPSYDLDCACIKAALVPLWTVALLPWYTADVAEVGTARAAKRFSKGYRGRGGGTNLMWLQPVSSSITRRQDWQVCHAFALAVSSNCWSAVSTGQSPS